MIKLVYIGQEFYSRSGTRMSSIYEIRDRQMIRSSWGDVQSELDNGEEVYIRQATNNEMLWAYAELEKYTR